MSAQGLEVIDHTVQITHEWINELKGRLDWTSSHDALRLLRSTLTAVRDRIEHDEMVQFAAQMPLLIRGMYYEGWKHSKTPIKDRSAEHFIAEIEERVGDVLDYRGPEDISTVFKLINARISDGEVSDVRSGLSQDIRSLWPE